MALHSMTGIDILPECRSRQSAKLILAVSNGNDSPWEIEFHTCSILELFCCTHETLTTELVSS